MGYIVEATTTDFFDKETVILSFTYPLIDTILNLTYSHETYALITSVNEYTGIWRVKKLK